MWNFLFGPRKPRHRPLGLTPSGRPVTPHSCDLYSTPSKPRLRSTTSLSSNRAVRPRVTSELKPSSTGLKSASSFSTIPAVRPKVTSHKCQRGASVTGLRRTASVCSVSSVRSRRVTSHKSEDSSSLTLTPLPQFKSPTCPKHRPVVTPHHCDLFGEGSGAHGSGGAADKSGSSAWGWFLFSLLLLGAAGAGVTAIAVAGKKKCVPRSPCRGR